MKEIIKKLIGSLDNKKDSGFSGRKLTAFTLMGCVVYMHYSWHTSEGFTENVLIIDLCAVGFFLGLITTAEIIKFKGGKEETKTEANENN